MCSSDLQDGRSALLDVTWMGPGLAPQASSPGSDQQPGLICRRGRSPGQAGAELTLARGRLGKGKLHGHVRAPTVVMPLSEDNGGLRGAGDKTWGGAVRPSHVLGAATRSQAGTELCEDTASPARRR